MKIVALLVALLLGTAAAASADPWLFVSDIHLDPANTSAQPVPLGSDTNEALLRSALAAMHRVAPHPPVVVIGGDFLAHDFDYRLAVPTMRHIARLFDATFPQAQFVIALGNEDSGCADYAVVPNSGFLDAAAAAWAPLVNRRGAAPHFRETFARDGSYVARLPLPGLQAVVIDDVFWSPRYHPCGLAPNASQRALSELRAALAGGARSLVMVHIPPGIDAFSTARYGHQLVVVPFLDSSARAGFEQVLTAPGAHVPFAIAGHVHRFSYRIVNATSPRAVPMLVLPSISSIFLNAPAFVLADVAPDGTLQRAREIAYDGSAWNDIGGTETLGVSPFSVPQLASLQSRLEQDESLRARFDKLYTGGARRPEINWSNWRVYLCAADHLGATPFRSCTGQPGVGVFTRRGIIAMAAGALALAALATLVVLAMRRRRRRTQT